MRTMFTLCIAAGFWFGWPLVMVAANAVLQIAPLKVICTGLVALAAWGQLRKMD